jgi:hypothetical protein
MGLLNAQHAKMNATVARTPRMKPVAIVSLDDLDSSHAAPDWLRHSKLGACPSLGQMAAYRIGKLAQCISIFRERKLISDA